MVSCLVDFFMMSLFFVFEIMIQFFIVLKLMELMELSKLLTGLISEYFLGIPT